jgi:hypothetical protein
MMRVAIDQVVHVLAGVDDRLVPTTGPVRMVGRALVHHVLQGRAEAPRRH